MRRGTTQQAQPQPVCRAEVLADEAISIIRELLKDPMSKERFDAAVEIIKPSYTIAMRVLTDYDLPIIANEHGHLLGQFAILYHPRVTDLARMSRDPQLAYLIKGLELPDEKCPYSNVAEYGDENMVTESHSKAMHYKMMILRRMS